MRGFHSLSSRAARKAFKQGFEFSERLLLMHSITPTVGVVWRAMHLGRTLLRHTDWVWIMGLWCWDVLSKTQVARSNFSVFLAELLLCG